MDERDERQVRAELDALNVEFWYRVDHLDGAGVDQLFTEDGVYSIAGGRNAGRRAIADSYVQRAARGPRLSRHVHSNLRIAFESPTRAHGTSTLTLWARDGEAPLDLSLPVSVSDVDDDYVLEDDGVWRIAHRHLTTVFQGPEKGVLPFGPAADDRED
jgi:hypothetical protein